MIFLDIINIIYLDGDIEFDPTSIKTHFTHVYIVIKAENVKIKGQIVPGYRIAISSSIEVPSFGPALPNPPVFTDMKLMQQFLCAKRNN